MDALENWFTEPKACSPLSASATTSTSDISSSNRRIPIRTNAWSSTISTLIK
ncbi:hypothetical protein FOLKNPGA_03736 (plasmid) [Legionella sp. PC1000]|nr:hypothetical protein FOLKNPGA_03736 [Legionella sp. PC1000]